MCDVVCGLGVLGRQDADDEGGEGEDNEEEEVDVDVEGGVAPRLSSRSLPERAVQVAYKPLSLVLVCAGVFVLACVLCVDMWRALVASSCCTSPLGRLPRSHHDRS